MVGHARSLIYASGTGILLLVLALAFYMMPAALELDPSDFRYWESDVERYEYYAGAPQLAGSVPEARIWWNEDSLHSGPPSQIGLIITPTAITRYKLRLNLGLGRWFKLEDRREVKSPFADQILERMTALATLPASNERRRDDRYYYRPFANVRLNIHGKLVELPTEAFCGADGAPAPILEVARMIERVEGLGVSNASERLSACSERDRLAFD